MYMYTMMYSSIRGDLVFLVYVRWKELNLAKLLIQFGAEKENKAKAHLYRKSESEVKYFQMLVKTCNVYNQEIVKVRKRILHIGQR